MHRFALAAVALFSWVGSAAAAAPVVLPTPRPIIDAVVEGLVPYIVVAIGGILTAASVIIVTLAYRHFKVKEAAVDSDQYEKATSAAAGMVIASLPADAPPNLSEASPAIAKGVDYMRTSYPEAIATIEKSAGRTIGHGELARDILAEVGKRLPGIGGMAVRGLSAILQPPGQTS